jgi:hypothetical protein
MITDIFENSLIIDIILLTFIVLGFSVCLFIFKRIVLTFKREKVIAEDIAKNTETQLANSEKLERVS